MIAVVGPPAAGKTTLLKELQRRGHNVVYEQQPLAQDGFCTQVSMLMTRRRQYLEAEEGTYFDRYWGDDDVFARVTLTEDEYMLYAQLRAALTAELPPPKAIIYLWCDPEVAQKRVKNRGTRTSVIPLIPALCEEYEAWIKKQSTPIMRFDTTQAFPVPEVFDVVF